MKNLLRLCVIVLVFTTLGGCAMLTPNFGVRQEFWQNKQASIGVAVAKLPKASALKGGNQGLLDIAINNANASDLEKALNTVDITSINSMPAKITAYLKQKGYNVKQIDTPIDLGKLPELQKSDNDGKGVYYTKKDFSSLKASLGVDKLILIKVNAVGTIRSYYGFIPLGDPSGYASLTGSVINLANNQMEWNQAVTQTVAHDAGEWDTPPKFALLTKAMSFAYVQSQSILMNDFTK